MHSTSYFVSHTVCIYALNLHGLDFFLEIFWDLFLFFFDNNLLTICYVVHPRNRDWCATSSTHVCIDEWRPTASTLCMPSAVFPTKNGCSYAQNEAQRDHLQRISWLLVTMHVECNTYRITVLGCLKRKKKMNNSDFRPFQVNQLRISFRYYITATVYWGSL